MTNELQQLYQQQLQHYQQFVSTQSNLYHHDQQAWVQPCIDSLAFATAELKHDIQNHQQFLRQSLAYQLYGTSSQIIPTTAVMECVPSVYSQAAQPLEKDTAFIANQLNQPHVYFKTCHHLQVNPIAIQQTDIHSHQLEITLTTLDTAYSIHQLHLESIAFYLDSTDYLALSLFNYFQMHVDHLELSWQKGQQKVILNAEAIEFFEFDNGTPYCPIASTKPKMFQRLKEQLCLPYAYQFFKINDLEDHLKYIDNQTCALRIYFKQPLDFISELKVKELIALNCVPIINLYSTMAEPIHYEVTKAQYPLHIEALTESDFAIYSVNGMQGFAANKTISCLPLFEHCYDTESKDSYRWQVLSTSQKHTEQEMTLHIQPPNVTHLSNSETIIFTPNITCYQPNALELLPTNLFGAETASQFSLKLAEPHLNKNWNKQWDTLIGYKLRGSFLESMDVGNNQSLNKLANKLSITHELLTLQNVAHCKALLLASSAKHTGHTEHIQAKESIHQGIIQFQLSPAIKTKKQKCRIGLIEGLHGQLTIDEQYFSNNRYLLLAKALHQFLKSLMPINQFLYFSVLNRKKHTLVTWNF